MNGIIPSIEELKLRAKRLREELNQQGTTISHSNSLELIAKEFGVKDWNTLFAKVGNAPPIPKFYVGQKVHGTYLGQNFTGTIHRLSQLSQTQSGYLRITLDFDEPVDVVTFKSFSNFRKRVNATIYESGLSPQRRSDGTPQITIKSTS
ncbi:MAG: glyoxalase superfamily protein [Nitratireductor sp.]